MDDTVIKLNGLSSTLKHREGYEAQNKPDHSSSTSIILLPLSLLQRQAGFAS